MTKTTTGSSRLTVILSWVIALVCLVGGALFIWLMPSPGQGAIDLQAKKQKSPKSISDKIKQEQAQRELPANYSEHLVSRTIWLPMQLNRRFPRDFRFPRFIVL